MKQGTIEKSAHLSNAKVVLGHAGAALDAAPELLREQHTGAGATPVRPAPSARERIAELEAELAASAQQLAGLQQQLGELQSSDNTHQAALKELQDTLTAAQLGAEQRGYADGSAAGEEAVRDEWQQQLAAWEQGLA
jgi:septal ring factor EnvC (AmiA/AmiB activator)